ncbi:Uncharacterised protein [uncultured archaeon]|nr:Uncharacterised protein [uncultured archaeon]
MNLAFRRDIIPAFYQFPMDDNPYGIGRYDDIWSGLVAKKCIDHIRGRIVNGFPLCEHNKWPRSTFGDLLLEAPGYESNEEFSRDLDDIEVSGSGFGDLARRIADELSFRGSTEFIRYCGRHLGRWVDACEELGAVRLDATNT